MATTPATPPVLEVPAQRHRIPLGYWLLLPGGLWLALFFIVPLYSLVATSLYDPGGGAIAGYEMTWSVTNYWHAIGDYTGPLGRSLLYGGIATVLCLLLGYPLAYSMAFKAGKWRNLMLVMVIAPFFTSFLIRTLAWKLILADQGIVVQTLQTLHLLAPGGHLLATPVSVVAGLTYNFIPLMVLPLYAALEKIDGSLIEAAQDLYASPLRGFLKVTLPLSMPGVVAGTLLTFIPAVGDYINTQLLGNTETRMLGNVIESLFITVGDYPAAAALSMVLMLLIVGMVMLYVRKSGTEELL
ncbi:MAG: ABC transporter permease [Gammaproteobacteria bacterium]|jgi:spermidine/putrescine transport system permease protein|nr:ABC transporter permease [Gammaproteobacteria bacterium]MBP6050855.1 ABC transporter permease [Pseudomonadales bacterium]MBK6584358.1 ABC transporter permease [Gammaproteobacteria bacterium]MBK7520818.1 ABC transporter permease [Gammaproteobacteria bacterium]MBK7727937.1 ABC transporter permease [Gammaproteobacteria bacterium]